MNLNTVPWPSVLIAIGSVIVVIGGFWAALEQSSSGKKLESLTRENQQLTTRLHEVVTGGDSYPFFVYGPSLRHIGDPKVLGVTLAVTGKSPIFDVNIDHMDVSEPLSSGLYDSPEETVNALLAKNMGPVRGGTFLPDRAFPVANVRMNPDWNERTFRLSTVARNGAFTQVTTLKKDPSSGRWYMTRVKVTKEVPGSEPDEVLKEEDFVAQRKKTKPN